MSSKLLKLKICLKITENLNESRPNSYYLDHSSNFNPLAMSERERGELRETSREGRERRSRER